jgi:hypothetical protein
LGHQQQGAFQAGRLNPKLIVSVFETGMDKVGPADNSNYISG